MGTASELDSPLRLRTARRRIFHTARDSLAGLAFYSRWLFADPQQHFSGRTLTVRDKSFADGNFLWRAAISVWDLPALYGPAGNDVNPEPFLKLDRVIHEKGRMAIMSLLAANPELSFTELREALTMTDGNLSVHLRTLQEAGYVGLTKSFQNRKPLTTCSLTAAGRKAFSEYIDLLDEIVRQTRR